MADAVGIALPGPGDRVLVVAPHQDDESIGCGGAVARWTSAGAVAGVLWMSATDRGELLGGEAVAAAEVLGVRWHHALGRSPYGLEGSSRELRDVVAAVRSFAPTVLVIPHVDEDDRQHRVTAELAAEARWLAAYDIDSELGDPVAAPRLVLAYEVWTPISRPTIYVDITATVDDKRRAISCYKTQIDIVRYDDAAVSLNRYRGLMSGVGDYAEAFGVLKAAT